MATFAIEQIDIAIELFTSLTQHGVNTPRYHRNLKWLQRLRARASSKVSKASTTPKTGPHRDVESERNGTTEERDDAEDVELLGWRTRLIERVGRGRPTVSTIRLPSTPAGSVVTNVSNPLPNQTAFGDPTQFGITNATRPGASLTFSTPDPTDDPVRAMTDKCTLTPLTSLASRFLGSPVATGHFWSA